MKFRVTFKTPDALVNAVEAEVERHSNLYAEAMDCAAKWMKYEEYITIEFDTETGTATVVETI
jgi:hypothetical protein